MSRWFVVPAFAVALLLLGVYWWAQGRPVNIAEAPAAHLPCVSYAPYRDGQSPFDETLKISPEQIAADLANLRLLSACVRTYSVEQGLAAVPSIARELGMSVMLGAWIGRDRNKNERELATVIDLAQRYPDSVKAVVVGNEVLLRREQPAAALKAMIERVRSAVPMPVTYADVWEFWQEHPEVADAVDFVTIHTLPYWEDEPRGIERAVPHVVAIWQQMTALFPDKRVFIGEAGWPSAGRMREAARPGAIEQARFVRELMIAANERQIGVNVIEAFDQPWKRKLEGTVGGHWGLLDSRRQPKFALQGPVSGEPQWRSLYSWSAALGMLLLLPALRRPRPISASRWFGLVAAAAVSGLLLAYGLRDGIDASRTVWDWAVLAFRVATAGVAAALTMEVFAERCKSASPVPISHFLAALRGRQRPAASRRDTVLGAVRAMALFGVTASTLCLVFDPRYRDFPAALIAVPAAAFLILALSGRRRRRDGQGMLPPPQAEERLLARILAVAAIGLVILEGLANHQALAWAATALVFAVGVLVDQRDPLVLVDHRRTNAIAPSNAPPAESSGA